MPLANRAAALLAGAAVVGALLAEGGVGATSRPTVRGFLSKAGFSTDDLAALERGEAVTRLLAKQMVAANHTAEVAVAGAIRVDVPRQAFIAPGVRLRGGSASRGRHQGPEEMQARKVRPQAGR